MPRRSAVAALALALCTVPGAHAEEPTPPVRQLPAELSPVQAFVMERLKSTVIPKVRFDGASIEEAIQFLRQKSKPHDPEEHGGVSFVLRTGPAGIPTDEPMLDLDLKDVSLDIALDHVCRLAGFQWTIHETFKILLTPAAPAPGAKPAPPARKLPEEMNPAQERMLKQLSDTIIPAVSFEEATFEQATGFLRTATGEQGMTLSILSDFSERPLPADRFITMELKEVPAGFVLDLLCEILELQWTLTERGSVQITPHP